MIIDIEGTDGCGKFTQTKMLYQYLTNKGYKCKIISFPNYDSPSSILVQKYLNGEFGDANGLNGYQASALYGIDRMLTMKQINVKDYDYILFDRYTPSNMIHQSRLLKSKREIDKFLDWVADFEYNKLKLPAPDIVIFLDMPVEYSLKLIRERGANKNGQSKDILENEEQLTLAYNSAKYAAQKMEWRTLRCVQNGGLLSKEIIHEKIKRIINNDY